MPDDDWTILRLIQWTTDYLGRHGSESPRLDAEVLLAHVRGCSRIQLYTAFDEQASDDLRRQYRQLVQRRASGTPVAYLVGYREFFSLGFHVNPHVLIPRPESELLVLGMLDHTKQNQPAGPSWRIADVGTGSGILAVCAAKYVPQVHVFAIDCQPAALDVARSNAQRHGVEQLITFLQGDLLQPVNDHRPVDIVVSNPPYVSLAEWDELPSDVKGHEPYVALVGGKAGDEIIRRLVDEAETCLGDGGLLIFEISPMLAPRVESWFSPSAWQPPTVTRDLAQHARVVTVQRSAD